MGRSDVAAVVIGRNEGDRLDRCLRSLADVRTLYVDAGSSDGSAALARSHGAEVIELDIRDGHTAARARNAGLDRLLDGADDAPAYIQMVDGDCVVDPGWMAAGAAALDADPRIGAVFGRLREIDPDASVYNWMCDVEWSVPPGWAASFAGNVMLRADAARHAGRYRSDMIAGEDPDYGRRFATTGWRIRVLADPMAQHDAGMTHFRQWWRRSIRSGHAFAELSRLHPASPVYRRSMARIVFWGIALPLTILIGAILAVAVDPKWSLIAAGALLLVAAQLVRATLRERRHHGASRAFALAGFQAIGKYAEAVGVARLLFARIAGRRPRAIDHRAA